MRPTTVVKLRSGFEHRNQPWSQSLRSYDASVGIRGDEELYSVLDFWENQSGACTDSAGKIGQTIVREVFTNHLQHWT